MSARENFESLMAADLSKLAGKLDINAPGRGRSQGQNRVAQVQAQSAFAPSQHACEPAPEMNLKKTNDLHPSWILEECKDVRMCLESSPTTQAVTSLISYKPQKSNLTEQDNDKTSKLDRFWAKAKAELKQTIPHVSYETWVAPCKLVEAEPGLAIIAVSSEFNRSQLTLRWLKTIKSTLSNLAQKPVLVRLIVDESLFQSEVPAEEPAKDVIQVGNPDVQTPPKDQWPMARYQNPTNCPKVANLLERYGDMRQVIMKSPVFRDAITPEGKGGWGIGLGAMIKAGNQYGLARLLYALEHTKAKLGANTKGGTFYYYLRNDFDPKRC